MLLINDQNEIHIDIQLGGAGMYMNTHTNAHIPSDVSDVKIPSRVLSAVTAP